MSTKVLIAHGNTQRLKRAVCDLQARGFEVAATPDGGDAFARFFEEAPDLVICSEILPGLSGINFARMVRSQSPATPVVILVDGEPGPEVRGFDVRPDPLNLEVLCAAYPNLVPVPPTAPASPSKVASTVEVFTLSALKRFQRGSHPLALLDEAGVSAMARVAEKRACNDGDLIIRQGDIGDGFYLVVEGQVRVTLREQADAEVARIGEGGFFGEMALLSDQPRSASVWAVGNSTLLSFGREQFLPILDAYPSLREVLSGVAIERSEENLWSVLLADDEVQESLAGLRGGPEDEVVLSPADLGGGDEQGLLERQATGASPGEPRETTLVMQVSLPPEPAAPGDAGDSVTNPALAASERTATHGLESTPAAAASGSPVSSTTALGANLPGEPSTLEVPASEATFRGASTPAPPAAASETLIATSIAGSANKQPVPGKADGSMATASSSVSPSVSTSSVPTSSSSVGPAPPASASPATSGASGLWALRHAPRQALALAGLVGLGIGAVLTVIVVLVLGVGRPRELWRESPDGGGRPPAAWSEPKVATIEASPTAPMVAVIPVAVGAPAVPVATAGAPEAALAKSSHGSVASAASVEGSQQAGASAAPAVIAPKLSDAERRELRKQFFARYRARDYATALGLGHKLRAALPNDWEVAINVADTERNLGKLDEALASYLGFIEKFPTNIYADDAYFWAADICITQGKKDEARPFLQKVLANPKSHYRAGAEERQKKL